MLRKSVLQQSTLSPKSKKSPCSLLQQNVLTATDASNGLCAAYAGESLLGPFAGKWPLTQVVGIEFRPDACPKHADQSDLQVRVPNLAEQQPAVLAAVSEAEIKRARCPPCHPTLSAFSHLGTPSYCASSMSRLLAKLQLLWSLATLAIESLAAAPLRKTARRDSTGTLHPHR